MPEVAFPKFAEKVIAWEDKFGRKELPWVKSRDPYVRWIAEIMLQQTQVVKVIPYFLNFMERFPDVNTLAESEEERVLEAWAGLGYYSRARNLLEAAREIHSSGSSGFPLTLEELTRLKGIGESTAGAIISACTGQPAVVLDGNVKRILSRVACLKSPFNSPLFLKEAKELAKELLPLSRGDAYSQGLMDLGAMVCTKSSPKCLLCPVSSLCQAFLSGEVNRYPVKKPSQKKPERTVCFGVAVKGGSVALVKRPAKGYWGGLWSLPEIPAPKEECRALPAFRHTFTHFILNANPFLLEEQDLENADFDWFPLSEIGSKALPTPIKTFLLDLHGYLEAPSSER